MLVNAPIAGDLGSLLLQRRNAFGQSRPEGHIRSIATSNVVTGDDTSLSS